MQITALAGGIGGARFVRGLLAAIDPADRVTVVVNTGDDLTLHGLRVCPDLDTVMYTLGDGVHEGQGWGRRDETFSVAAELAAHGAQPQWFTLGDRDIATHIVRTRLLGQGLTPSQVTAALCERWLAPLQGRVRLLPMTDDRVETHVVIDEPAESPDAAPGRRAVHFQEWWVRLHAAVPARQILAVGIEGARPAPGVLEAITEADVVILPPSNPVVSIGMILAVPGVREALRTTTAPVVGVSPIIGGAPVRGMADACLSAIGVPTTAAAVAGLYADLLDGWLVAPGDGEGPYPEGVRVIERPLLMTDVAATAEIASAALGLAEDVARQRVAT